MSTVIVTGGAGFIGSALIRFLIEHTQHTVVNLDKLTYAGNLESLETVREHARYHFEHADICDSTAVKRIYGKYFPVALFHLAAESHVDRSIDEPAHFIKTNVEGTLVLLQATRHYLEKKEGGFADLFRLIHVSTDEVFGSLGNEGLFTESSPYDPHSPYSASKAASDHLARAWHHTYGLPVIITNCSNNYGPYQFPEKLIPVVILKALRRQPIPIYGKGDNVRDWLFVEDHVRALVRVFERGKPGETYNIGGRSECSNLQIVRNICSLLDMLVPKPPQGGFASLISFVSDRLGHDFRYAIDVSKIERELDWRPTSSLQAGLESTIRWYLGNQAWCERVTSGKYRQERLGLMQLS